MKYLSVFTSIFLCILSIPMILTNPASLLRIDIVEAVNLHCKLNNEFYCNPYAIVTFKYSDKDRTTKRIECTKNPKWESAFEFDPEFCQDVIFINFYQYLTPRDSAFLGSAVEEVDRFEMGEIMPGYLGRVILDLQKMPFAIIDDWFMIESPLDISRVMFPSCVHLRISWTSTTCPEPTDSYTYQLDSIKPKQEDEDEDPDKFEPKNFLPMCKQDFALVYKTKFSRLDREGPIYQLNEIDLIKERSRMELHCKMDLNEDFGFHHKYSNLTSVEEALVFKIIKRTTGENINYKEFTRDFKKNHHKYLKSYKEFFEKDCFAPPEMTIERVNNLLRNDASKFPTNTSNPYLTPKLDEFDYPLKLNRRQMEHVYNDTLDQFYAIEDIKNVETMDDDSYLQTVNKMVEVMKDIRAEKKIDSTIFQYSNKVMLNNEGRVDPKEERFFRIYALYKWNGGQFGYDEIKREYMLRRKYFYCYEIIKVMPTNILFQFIDDGCPDNYLCVDPNGIIIKSNGRNPRKVFQTDIEKNGLNFFINMHNNKIFEEYKKVPATNLRFKSLESKLKETDGDHKTHPIQDKSGEDIEVETNEKKDDEAMNFKKLLNMEVDMNHPSIDYDLLDSEDDHYRNKFDQFYISRRARIKKKKEIIINKVFNNVPLIGEILAIANLDVLDKNINHKFLAREYNLMKKYLLIYNSQIPFVEQAARLLVDLVLCNVDKNRVRYTLRELLEGLCYADDRSIKIFEEIVRTVVMDSLLKSPLWYFEELHSKVNLVKTLNKPFCYKSIVKIRFVEKMLMMDIVKEKVTYIIWNNDTNKKIALKIHDTELSIPATLPDNKRLFAYTPDAKSFDNAKDVNKNFLNEMDRIDKFDELNKQNNPAGFKFKSIRTVIDEDEPNEKKDSNAKKNLNITLKNKDVKTNHTKTLNKFIKNNKREGEVEVLGKLENMRRELDFDLDVKIDSDLDEQIEFEPEQQSKPEKEHQRKSKSKRKRKSKNDDDLMNEVAGLFSMHFKEKDKEEESEEDEEDTELKDQEKETEENENSKHKSEENIKKNVTTTNSTFYNNFTVPHFKSLDHDSDQDDMVDDSNNRNTESSDEFAKVSLNQYNNPHIYERHDEPGASILSTNQQPTSQDILEKVMKDPETRKLIEETKTQPQNKVLFPHEIHSTFEVNKRGTKQITINRDNPTKKLIIGKLMDEKTYNDMMNQEEQSKISDQTGLYMVLKNIQNKKCSCDFLCIEIGTIYGPFDNLKPQNVTVMTNHKENVQLIIKPVIVVNNTITRVPFPVPVPVPPPDKPIPPPAPPAPPAPAIENFAGLFEEEDCDILKMSAIAEHTSVYKQNIRFKELVEQNVRLAVIKRKFYRKVEYGNEILATEIFKQGLNVIILKRERGYRKLYERTFNTNLDSIESEAMACVLRDAGYDKIVVITGIGKWMGSITPRLVKEIKQIGGPDINRLISIDSEDNAMADHAFILIGRRGLCRYNGVFRVKNYDISRDLRKYFPDLSSDPNDCFFENLTFENEKNKHSEKQFFHLIDLRLTLNLANDNRFSYRAPIVTNVAPPFGALNGGTCLQIRGSNFGASTLEIKEVLVRGVVCRDVILVNPNLISCTTGSSTIMGPGVGNVQVKLVCGLSSPVNTCNMFEYTKEERLLLEEPSAILRHAPIVVAAARPIPVLHFIHPTPHFPPPPPSLHHHHYVRPGVLPPPAPMVLYPPALHHVPAHHVGHIAPAPMPLFAFKEKEKKYDENGHPDMKDIMNNLNNKLFSKPDPNSRNVEKIDNLVSDNLKNMIQNANSNDFNTPRDGFRKKRFAKLVQQLK